MGRELGLGPGVVVDPEPAKAQDAVGEGIAETACSPARRGTPALAAGRGRFGVQDRQQLAGDVGGGHQLAADALGQGSDRAGDEFLAHPRDQPVEALRAHSRQHGDRDRHGDAVGVGAGCEGVFDGEAEVALDPLGGIVPFGRLRFAQEELPREVEEAGGLPPRLLPPRVEMAAGDDVGRDPLLVEGLQSLWSGHEPPPAQLLLELLRVPERLRIVAQEGVVGAPLTFDEAVADEHLPRELAGRVRAEGGQRLRAVGDERDPVQRHFLLAHRRAAARTPVGLGICALDQVPGQRLDPSRFDRRDRPREETRGLHQFGRHHPGGIAPVEARARPDDEMRTAGPAVVARAFIPGADVGQQADEHRAVDRPGLRRVGAAAELAACGGHGAGTGRSPERRGIGLGPDLTAGRQGDGAQVEPQGLGQLAELGGDVGPLPVAQIVEELAAAHAAERRARQLPLLGVEIAPQGEVGQEVGAASRETRMELVRLGALLGRALADVLDGERGDQDEHLGGAAVALRLQEHAAQARVDGQASQLAADARQTRLLAPAGRPRFDGPDLGQELRARAHRPGVGRVDEGEGLDVAEAQGEHAEYHRGQRGPLDLRLGEFVACGEVGLRVQADADAVGDAPAPARALVGAGPGDRLDGQALNLRLVGVARYAGGPRVDDVADAGDREGGLGDVRRQDDAPVGVRREDPVLLGRREPRVERQHLDRSRHRGAPAAFDALGSELVVEGRFGVADLTLSGEEDEDVTRAFLHELPARFDDARHLVDGPPAGRCDA